MRLALPLTTLLLLSACAGDPDEDGLKSSEEKDLGLDPKVADSDGDGMNDGDEVAANADPLNKDTDGDGLLDGEEVAAGSDPVMVDSDEDTYNDYDEVQTGHDPADAEDRIYQGYWPYNPTKDDLGDGSDFDGMPAEVGEQFPRFKDGKDQFRDVVDLYDFAGKSLIVLDGSASWCGPCRNTASWLSGGSDPYALDDSFRQVRKAVDNGEVAWVTVLTDGMSGPAELSDVKDWDREFPNEKVPVMTDPNGDMLYALNYDGSTYLSWPGFVVLDENMEVVYVGGATDTLNFVKNNM